MVYKYTHTHWNKKEGNLAICNNVDGPNGYFLNWNKSDRERQILYDFTYMWNLKIQNKRTNTTKQNGHIKNIVPVINCIQIWDKWSISKKNNWGTLKYICLNSWVHNDANSKEKHQLLPLKCCIQIMKTDK